MSTSDRFMKKKTTFDRWKPSKKHRPIVSTLGSKAAGVCCLLLRLGAFVSNKLYGQYLWTITSVTTMNMNHENDSYHVIQNRYVSVTLLAS